MNNFHAASVKLKTSSDTSFLSSEYSGLCVRFQLIEIDMLERHCTVAQLLLPPSFNEESRSALPGALWSEN